MEIHLFDASEYRHTEPVRSLMLSALPFPNEEIVDRLLDRYYDDEQMCLIAALGHDDSLLGLVGLRLDEPGAATILHLHVADPVRRQGVGRLLLEGAAEHVGVHHLRGRSSSEVLPFFEHLGFVAQAIGEKPRGVPWYRVERGFTNGV